MKRLLTLFAAAGGALFAQSTTVRTFEALMSPSKEVPAVNAAARGTCQVELVVTRDAAGAVTSARVDFHLQHWLGQAEKLTGFHIHRGGEGVAGPVVINTGLRGPIDAAAGAGQLFYGVNVDPTDANVTLLTAIQNNPAGYYVNLHTETNPGGQFRGQLGNTAGFVANNSFGIVESLRTTLGRVAFRLGIDLAQ